MRQTLFPLLATLITLAPADSARGQSGAQPVMEIVTFRLVPGTSDADFLAAAQATGVLVSAQSGFVSRSLLRDETGVWTDSITWQSLPQAHAAAETVMAHSSFAAFAAAIDMTSLTMRHVPILWQMAD